MEMPPDIMASSWASMSFSLAIFVGGESAALGVTESDFFAD